MPSSSAFGKFTTAATLIETSRRRRIERILDIGPGQGTYWSLLSPYLWGAEFTAIEVWGPYITGYKLNEMYNRVIAGDARYIDYSLLPRFDLTILGDIVEHMSRSDGLQLLRRLLNCSLLVVTSIPVTYAPQGEHFGNPWEIHIEDNYTQLMIREAFPNIVAYEEDAFMGLVFMSEHEDIAQLLRSCLELAKARVAGDIAQNGYLTDTDYPELMNRLSRAFPSSTIA